MAGEKRNTDLKRVSVEDWDPGDSESGESLIISCGGLKEKLLPQDDSLLLALRSILPLISRGYIPRHIQWMLDSV